MVQIAVCDDEALHLRHTVSLIEEAFPTSRAEISAFSCGSELLKRLVPDGYLPDLAVLDIRMKDIDGLSLARELNRLAPHCQIIYLTAYPSYAPDAYLTNHVWFIPKDRTKEFLPQAIERAISGAIPYKMNSTITLRKQGKVIAVPFQDILYIDRVGRKTRVVCLAEEHLITQKPSSVIPDSVHPYIIHCHQGFWVNSYHVASIDHNEFVLDNQTRIPISRSYRNAARTQFFQLHRQYETPTGAY